MIILLRTIIYLEILSVFSACKKENSSLQNQPPENISIHSELIGVDPFTYRFVVSATDPDDDLLMYSWNLGEGTAQEGEAEETFTFEPDKEYVIKVNISDGAGHHVEASTTINTQVTKISIHADEKFQTIEGFGGFGAQKVWWEQAPFYDETFIDLLINDLGITILRDNIPISFEPKNDNDNPNDLDLSNFNLTQDTPGADSHLEQHLPYLKAMQKAGLEKFIVSIWSPPIWMKHIDHRGNGIDDSSSEDAYSAPPYTENPDENTNQLKRENYEEFAEYCVAYIQTIKQKTGLDVYALSIQNEPVFSQFYASCVYSPQAYRHLLKVVGQRFKGENINTKLFGTEDVQTFDRIENFLNIINSDPEAKKQLDIIAIHNYKDDGINPSAEGPTHWRNTHEIANTNGQQLWMTETSGFEDGWKGAFALTKSVYNALKFGQVNAWVYWQMSEGSDQALLFNNQPTDLYYASKHFYRYIRPGAVQIASNSDNSNVLVLAYEHTADNNSTIILINNSTQQQVVKLPESSISYEVYQSDTQQKFAEKDKYEGGMIILPAESLTTLYGH